MEPIYQITRCCAPKTPGLFRTIISTLPLCPWCLLILYRNFRRGRATKVPESRQVRKCQQKLTRMVSSLCCCTLIRGSFTERRYDNTHTHTQNMLTHTERFCVLFSVLPFKHYVVLQLTYIPNSRFPMYMDDSHFMFMLILNFF
jgi:hypothetical protein